MQVYPLLQYWNLDHFLSLGRTVNCTTEYFRPLWVVSDIPFCDWDITVIVSEDTLYLMRSSAYFRHRNRFWLMIRKLKNIFVMYCCHATGRINTALSWSQTDNLSLFLTASQLHSHPRLCSKRASGPGTPRLGASNICYCEYVCMPVCMCARVLCMHSL